MSFRRPDVAIDDFGVDSYQRWPVGMNLTMWREHDLRFGGSQLLWNTALRAMKSNGVRATWGIRRFGKPMAMFEGKTFRDMNRQTPDEFDDAALRGQLFGFIEALTDMRFRLFIHKAKLLPPSKGAGVLIPASFPWVMGNKDAMLVIKIVPTKTEPVHLPEVPMVDALSVESAHVVLPCESEFSLEIHTGNRQRNLGPLPVYDMLPISKKPIPGLTPSNSLV